MNVTMSNIKKLVNNCNAAFNRQNKDFQIMVTNILDTSGTGTIAELLLHTNSSIAQYKYCNILLRDGNNAIDISIGNAKIRVELERKVEIEQLIIFVLTEYMLYGTPPKWIITQSISGWTNAKVVFNQNGKRACIHTVVIKQLMISGIVNIINAKIASNGNIIVDYKNYNQTNYHTGPNNLWWD